MLLSCGVDIVSIKRVEKLLERYGDRFIKKVFPEGIEYCYQKRKGELAGCIAARFALKEAIIKALSGIEKKVTLSEIVIIGGGKNLEVKLKNHKEIQLIYSISHEKDYAVAMVNVIKLK
ncbi:Holo-(acyl-carrier-protein) synthase [Desulfurobacterium thermolithotrophum DSM 11699]|uniref:Holo-[acyl-carrier-protein] synthase n=1 Tax=Desulfurobacterium thermolithotrophum (strain DSM 11699 / BSA) TaxID=868864 RepID=F0S3Y3_DESTD|nr:holo-ACP synthase [Desulfurobacterium thermolithotrophum]ADY73555.1 Holo-(acyl-carrier-protein) synthase [Desulfurobacterium thermolithotrophum DSM 11699]